MWAKVDEIANIKGYSFNVKRHQYKLLARFRKELNSHNLDDAVSEFWAEVANCMSRARPVGLDIQAMESVGSFTSRPTHMSESAWLRERGMIAVRNYLNREYRSKLIQMCSDCGKSARIHKRELNQDCPKCKSSNTIKSQVQGSFFKNANKFRSCQDCNHKWKRVFRTACPHCDSFAVQTIPMVVDMELPDTPIDTDHTQDSHQEIMQILNLLASRLPKSPGDETYSTGASRILDILAGGDEARKLCAFCSLNCPDSCHAPKFDVESCVRAVDKISLFMGVSRTMTSRRVGIIRKYLLSVVKESELPTAKYIYEYITKVRNTSK